MAHLHELAPRMSDDSLHRKGNFQFTLFVDGREIYVSELLPGAPLPSIQDSATVLNRALIDNVEGSGSWSESFWNRFMNRGGEKALTDGDHVLRMEIRPYVQADALRIGKLMAAGEVKIHAALHPSIDVSKVVLNVATHYPGIDVSRDHFDAGPIKTLKGKIEAGEFRKVNGIVVLRDGRLLIEEYFNGEGRNSLHDTRSVGKSFASALMGMAIQDGHLKSLDQRLKDLYDLGHFAHPDSLKDRTSLRDLLTMSSGFDGDDEDDASPGNEENMYPTDDWVKFALDLPMRKESNGDWHYFTAGVVLLGDILDKKLPGGLERFADKRLFGLLGIVHHEWQYTPQHVPNTAGGLRLNALDLAKFGQLYKNKGVWNGKRIIDASWVDSSFRRHKKIGGRDEEYYGYLFWNKVFHAGTKAYEAYYCAGNGGNYILVFKDQPLVIVITASAYGQPYAHRQVTEMLEKYILPALAE